MVTLSDPQFLRLVPPPAVLIQRFRLTAREADVAVLLAYGARNKTIADRLQISIHTARHHVEMVLTKLGAKNRTKVAVILISSASQAP